MSLVLLVSCAIQALGQEWSLGPYQYVIASNDKKQKATLEHFAQIGSFETHYKLGGIAFTQTAIMGSGIENLTIKYDPGSPDGSRLVITVNGTTPFQPRIFDWQLKPIAEFANSRYNSVVTIKRTEGNKYRDVICHEAFTNQLLGIRAIQADKIAFMSKEYFEKPSENVIEGLSGFMKYNKQEVFGIGEENLNEGLKDISKAASRELGKIVSERGSYANRSMILDHDVEITASVSEGKFVLKGAPYIQVLLAYNNYVRFFWPTTAAERELSSNLFRKINPYIFQSMKTLSSYSALFRYIKMNNSENWNEFLKSIQDIKTYPNVVTPDTEQR